MSSGISPTPAAFRTKIAFHAAAKVAMEGRNVDVDFGLRDLVINQDYLAVLGGRSQMDPKNIGPRRQMDEVIEIDVEIATWSPLYGEEGELAVQTRAFEIFDLLCVHIHDNDLTLGGTVQWCFPQNVEWDGATAEDDAGWGRLCIVAATFQAQHRVR